MSKLSAKIFLSVVLCQSHFALTILFESTQQKKIQIGQKESISISSLRLENLTTTLYTINLQRTFCQKCHILNKYVS
jgi:hypothetical protein